VKGRLLRPAAVALALIVLVALFALAYLGQGESASDEKRVARVSRGELSSIPLGMSRKDVEHRLGKGADALEYDQTGVAVEPMDAKCVYYARVEIENIRAVAQLCYRHNKLTSKRLFPATPGAIEES